MPCSCGMDCKGGAPPALLSNAENTGVALRDIEITSGHQAAAHVKEAIAAISRAGESLGTYDIEWHQLVPVHQALTAIHSRLQARGEAMR